MNFFEFAAADDEDRIPYRKKLNVLTGSVTASILLQQISYWWHKNGKKPFYKFSAPAASPQYKKGDSWQEELGMTETEFTNARDKIAVRCKAGTSKAELRKTAYIIYWVDSNRLTWYEFDSKKASDMLEVILNPSEPRMSDNPGFPDSLDNPGFPDSLDNPGFPDSLISETTTETTTDTKTGASPQSGNGNSPTPLKPKGFILAVRDTSDVENKPAPSFLVARDLSEVLEKPIPKGKGGDDFFAAARQIIEECQPTEEQPAPFDLDRLEQAILSLKGGEIAGKAKGPFGLKKVATSAYWKGLYVPTKKEVKPLKAPAYVKPSIAAAQKDIAESYYRSRGLKGPPAPINEDEFQPL